MAQDNQEVKPYFKRHINRISFEPKAKFTEDQKQRLITQTRWEHLMSLGRLIEGSRKVIFDPYMEMSRDFDEDKFPRVNFTTMFNVTK